MMRRIAVSVAVSIALVFAGAGAPAEYASAGGAPESCTTCHG